jgi:homoserine dehydrogenase
MQPGGTAEMIVPACRMSGVVFEVYRDQPLVIQGPGAGSALAAAALLDDALRLNAWARTRTP